MSWWCLLMSLFWATKLLINQMTPVRMEWIELRTTTTAFAFGRWICSYVTDRLPKTRRYQGYGLQNAVCRRIGQLDNKILMTSIVVVSWWTEVVSYKSTNGTHATRSSLPEHHRRVLIHVNMCNTWCRAFVVDIFNFNFMKNLQPLAFNLRRTPHVREHLSDPGQSGRELSIWE